MASSQVTDSGPPKAPQSLLVLWCNQHADQAFQSASLAELGSISPLLSVINLYITPLATPTDSSADTSRLAQLLLKTLQDQGCDTAGITAAGLAGGSEDELTAAVWQLVLLVARTMVASGEAGGGLPSASGSLTPRKASSMPAKGGASLVEWARVWVNAMTKASLPTDAFLAQIRQGKLVLQTMQQASDVPDKPWPKKATASWQLALTHGESKWRVPQDPFTAQDAASGKTPADALLLWLFCIRQSVCTALRAKEQQVGVLRQTLSESRLPVASRTPSEATAGDDWDDLGSSAARVLDFSDPKAAGGVSTERAAAAAAAAGAARLDSDVGDSPAGASRAGAAPDRHDSSFDVDDDDDEELPKLLDETILEAQGIRGRFAREGRARFSTIHQNKRELRTELDSSVGDRLRKFREGATQYAALQETVAKRELRFSCTSQTLCGWIALALFWLLVIETRRRYLCHKYGTGCGPGFAGSSGFS